MNGFLRHNRTWVSFVLMLAIAVMGTGSGASWQCADGKPCDVNCKMLHGASSKAHAHAAAHEGVCSHCPTAPSRSLNSSGSGGAGCSCTTPRCVLRVSEKPSSSLQEGVRLIAPTPAVLPVIATVPLDVINLDRAPAVGLSLLARRFLRPLSGRAPPSLLYHS